MNVNYQQETIVSCYQPWRYSHFILTVFRLLLVFQFPERWTRDPPYRTPAYVAILQLR